MAIGKLEGGFNYLTGSLNGLREALKSGTAAGLDERNAVMEEALPDTLLGELKNNSGVIVRQLFRFAAGAFGVRAGYPAEL